MRKISEGYIAFTSEELEALKADCFNKGYQQAQMEYEAKERKTKKVIAETVNDNGETVELRTGVTYKE